MNAMFGHKWVSAYGADIDPTGIWLQCLEELQPAHIQYGIAVLKNSGLSWPPSAPEFRSMCLPTGQRLGLPSEFDAYNQLLEIINVGGQIDWFRIAVHPAVYYTYANLLDPYAMKRATTTQHRDMFTKAYRVTMNRAAGGFKFPPIPQAIEHQPQPVSGAEKAQRKAEAISELQKLREKSRI